MAEPEPHYDPEPDARRLLDLLDLLPYHSDAGGGREWWTEFCKTERKVSRGAPPEASAGYVTSHLFPDLHYLRDVLDPPPPPADPDVLESRRLTGYDEEQRKKRPENLAWGAGKVAMYCLMFFDGERPKMWEHLDRLCEFNSPWPGAVGRRWAEDVCATAWRLYTNKWVAEVRASRAQREGR